jgi:hypothetical protein
MKQVYCMRDAVTGKKSGYRSAGSESEARMYFGAAAVGAKLELIPYPGNEYALLEAAAGMINKLRQELENASLS